MISKAFVWKFFDVGYLPVNAKPHQQKSLPVIPEGFSYFQKAALFTALLPKYYGN